MGRYLVDRILKIIPNNETKFRMQLQKFRRPLRNKSAWMMLFVASKFAGEQSAEWKERVMIVLSSAMTRHRRGKQ